MSQTQNEGLLSLLIEHGALAPVPLCRMVCRSWCAAFDSCMRCLSIRELGCQARGLDCSGGELGVFLRKLSRLESIRFHPSFRKGVAKGRVADPDTEIDTEGEQESVSSALAARRKRQSERKWKVTEAWGEELDSPRKRPGGTLRELERMRLLIACDALKVRAPCKVAFPFCRISPVELREVLNVVSAGDGTSKIQCLDLRGNFFGVEGARVISEFLHGGMLKELVELDISSNDLLLQGVEAIASALESDLAPRLRTLRIGENGIDKDGAWADALGRLAGSCLTLEELDVDKAQLGHSCFQSFSACLATSTSLTRLRLVDSHLESAGPEVLSPLPSSSSIMTLCLQRSNLNAAAATVLAGTAASDQWPQLRDLDLGQNSLGVEGARAIAHGIANGALCSLTRLDLSLNQLREAGAAALAEAVAENRSLQTLNLSSNAIRAQGGTSIADMLRSSKGLSLTSIDLSNNTLDPEGVAAVARGLVECASLRDVNLAFNCGGREAALALGDAFGSKMLKDGGQWRHALEELDVSYNNMGRRDAAARGDAGDAGWVRVLLLSCPLRRLHLSYNLIGDALATAIASALSGGGAQQLRTLTARGNALTREGLATMREAWSANAVLCQRVELLDVQDNLSLEGADALSPELDLQYETRAALGAVPGGRTWSLCAHQVA